MKILALNSSPRGGGQSKTEIMLNALVAGMREAGAEVEVVDLWMDLVTGKADGQQMFLDQKYTVEGDFTMLMQMDQLFGNNQ